MTNRTGLDYVKLLINRGESALRQMEKMGRSPNDTKELERRWSVKEAEHL